MDIKEIKIMRGPSYWSITHHQLIVLKVKSEDDEKQQLPAALKVVQAALRRQEVSGADDLTADTDPSTLVVRIAQMLLRHIRSQCGYVDVRDGADPHVKFLLYEYIEENSGVCAGETAVNLYKAALQGKDIDLEDDLREMRKLLRYNLPGPTTTYIMEEVKRRHIPFRFFQQGSLVALGHGHKQKKMRTAVTDTTSGLGIELAGDKEETRGVLDQGNFPVPKGALVYSLDELRSYINRFRFPLVVKPFNGNHGRGVTTNIRSMEEAEKGWENAHKISDGVIVEEHIEGDDYRLLVVNYQLVAAARRIPASVTGDGKQTIRELVARENLHPDRGESAEHTLAPITIDTVTIRILNGQGLTPDSVPAEGKLVKLKDIANISAGGTADDVTDIIHPETKFLAERIAKLFSLDICGIDVMAADIEKPLTRENGAVIEVNAGPGIRMHTNPQTGTSRNVATPIIDMLFKEPSDAKIPIIAVTGTNGKTTTVRLIAHMSQVAGFKTGFTTTEGIYIDGHQVYKGDCTGYVSSQDVLFDPGINLAVLECARGGILRSGLAFESCDISVVTNISDDHLGMKDINSLEEMRRVKSVVPRATHKSGYTILNADDDLVYEIRKEVSCQVALFSIDPHNERLVQHCAAGGLGATIEEGHLVVLQGEWKLDVDEIDSIPLSFNGRATSMIRNLMPAALAGIIMNYGIDRIREALRTFFPSPAMTPGRMNVFDFNDFEVLVDYAHNVDGFVRMKEFIDATKATRKTGIIAVAGDRRDEDFIRIGSLAAQTFDRIIIRHDRDTRGRDNADITRLLREGIAQGGKTNTALEISNEEEAVRAAVKDAVKGEFIMVCADKVEETLKFMSSLKSEVTHESV